MCIGFFHEIRFSDTPVAPPIHPISLLNPSPCDNSTSPSPNTMFLLKAMFTSLLPLILTSYQQVDAAVPDIFPSKVVVAPALETKFHHPHVKTPAEINSPAIAPATSASTPDISATKTVNNAYTSATAIEAAQNSAGISSGNVNNSLPDPCGPAVQNPEPAGSRSTCHTNVSVADTRYPSRYGVQCLNDGTGEVLDQNTCAGAIYTICYQISGLWSTRYQATNQWIWSTENGNCTFGYWLPKGGAPPPSYDRCRDQIMAPMNDKCTGPDYNVGAINLKELPAADSRTGIVTTGKALDGGWPSYIMVAQQSFWGVNSMDT